MQLFYLRFFLSTFLIRLYGLFIARRYFTYREKASLRTTNRQPPTKLRPHRSCRIPVFGPREGLVTKCFGRSSCISAPMP